MFEPKRNKPQTILMRIMTGYIQTIIVVKNFDLNWNSILLGMFDNTAILFSTDYFELSLECFYLALYST